MVWHGTVGSSWWQDEEAIGEMRTQTLPAISTSRQLDVSWIWSLNSFAMILLICCHFWRALRIFFFSSHLHCLHWPNLVLRYNFFCLFWAPSGSSASGWFSLLCKKHPKTRKCDWDVGKERYRVIKCKMSIWTNRVARTWDPVDGTLMPFPFGTHDLFLWQLEEHWTPPETPLGSPLP